MTGEPLWEDPREKRVRAFAGLLKHLQSPNPTLQKEHVRVLADMAPEEVQHWKRLWSRLPLAVRQRVMDLCCGLLEEDPRLSFFDVGRLALEDEDPYVREQGLRLIGVEDLEARSVVPLLIRHLWDEAPQVRAQAASQLGSFVLQGMVHQMPYPLLRRAVAALLYILHEEPPTAPVWAQALMAVGYAAPRGLEDFLEFAYYQGDIRLRCAALVAMGRTLDERWKAYILADLQHPHPDVRAAAAQAAGLAEVREALDEVLYLLTDASKEVRIAAAWAVSELSEDEQHLTVLEQAWRQAEDDEEIQALEEALQNLEFRLMRREWNLLEWALKEDLDQPPRLDLRPSPGGTNGHNGSEQAPAADGPEAEPDEPGLEPGA